MITAVGLVGPESHHNQHHNHEDHLLEDRRNFQKFVIALISTMHFHTQSFHLHHHIHSPCSRRHYPVALPHQDHQHYCLKCPQNVLQQHHNQLDSHKIHHFHHNHHTHNLDSHTQWLHQVIDQQKLNQDHCQHQHLKHPKKQHSHNP
ncbi:hypothetical protein OIU74_022753 [Salix koriyanagi]|uniref:Uncharacterized protein n=1 Tax=Salix koriyanagi TaxID=2511006 RepID=A0A9Q0WNH3_9ROSI|nr:hypothetical protein OIU74_022753 [Salix koriyanagi]